MAQNFEIVELRQVYGATDISLRKRRKVFFYDDILYGTYFPAMLVWL